MLLTMLITAILVMVAINVFLMMQDRDDQRGIPVRISDDPRHRARRR